MPEFIELVVAMVWSIVQPLGGVITVEDVRTVTTATIISPICAVGAEMGREVEPEPLFVLDVLRKAIFALGTGVGVGGIGVAVGSGFGVGVGVAVGRIGVGVA